MLLEHILLWDLLRVLLWRLLYLLDLLASRVLLRRRLHLLVMLLLMRMWCLLDLLQDLLLQAGNGGMPLQLLKHLRPSSTWGVRLRVPGGHLV